MKKCWKCKEFKNLEDFYKDITTKDGLSKACKLCQIEYSKKYNKEHKEYFKQKNDEYYQKKFLNDTEYNRKRYNFYKEKYLKRQDASLRTVRGRLYSIFDAARGRSRKRDTPFEISLEDVLEKYETQNGSCALTNIEFSLDRLGRKGKNPFAPSIDRIDSHKGYTKENIRLVCVIVNLALNNFGDDAFDKMCRAYINSI